MAIMYGFIDVVKNIAREMDELVHKQEKQIEDLQSSIELADECTSAHNMVEQLHMSNNLLICKVKELMDLVREDGPGPRKFD